MRKKAIWIVLLAIFVLIGFSTIKLAQKDRSWKPLSIAQGSRSSRVEIFSPPYGKNARPPDRVTVEWDGKIIFKGALPIRESGPDGMPVTFAKLQVSPGPHVLQIESNGDAAKKSFDINSGETRYFHLFGVGDRRETLLLDYGAAAPMFQ